MRTTLTLDDDVVAAINQVRRDEGVGISEAVNRLLRESLARSRPRHRYRHRTADLGLKVDVANVAEVLELLDDT